MAIDVNENCDELIENFLLLEIMSQMIQMQSYKQFHRMHNFYHLYFQPRVTIILSYSHRRVESTNQIN